MKQSQLDPIVKKIAQSNTKPIVDKSLREIQAEIFAITGHTPSTSVLSLSMGRLGIVARGRRWIWKHREDHE